MTQAPGSRPARPRRYSIRVGRLPLRRTVQVAIVPRRGRRGRTPSLES